jgi:hypothetical protein
LQVRSPFNDTSLYFKKERRLVTYVVIAAIIAVNSVIILFSSTTEEKNYAGNILRPLVAGVAVTFSLIVVYRQKLDGLLGRAYASLAIGLVLWLAAELVWAYSSIVVRIEVPFPSLADVFWLLGYGPLGYHLFSTARLHRAFHNASKRIFVVSAAVSIFSLVYILDIVSASLTSNLNNFTALAISITYPIADAIVIVPAVLTIAKSGRGELTAVPWIFISWIFTAVADALFGYTAVTNIAGDFSIWNLFYNAAYLIMAAGLYWHNKFFVMDDDKMKKLWKKENR